MASDHAACPVPANHPFCRVSCRGSFAPTGWREAGPTLEPLGEMAAVDEGEMFGDGADVPTILVQQSEGLLETAAFEPGTRCATEGLFEQPIE